VYGARGQEAPIDAFARPSSDASFITVG
jgi:hypothetical protein